MLGKLKGYQELSVDDAVLRLLALRQLALVQALEERGHAAQKPIEIGSDAIAPKTQAGREDWRNAKLPDELLEARSQPQRSEEHTSELQSLMRIAYAVFCLKKKQPKH